MLRDYVETLPDVHVVADLITTRVVLAVAFISAFVNTGVPQMLSALAVISLLVFFVFEYRRVRARKVLVHRLDACSPPCLSSVHGQQRAIVRALSKFDECILIVSLSGIVVASAGRAEDLLGCRSEDLIGEKPHIPEGSRVEKSPMILDSTEYEILRISR